MGTQKFKKSRMFLCGGRRVWVIVLTALTISAAPLTLRAADEPDGVLNTHAALPTYPTDEPAGRPAAAVPAGDMPLQVQHASTPLTVVATEPAMLAEPAVLTVSMAAPPRNNDVGDAVVPAADAEHAVGEAQAYRVSASTGPAIYAARDLGHQFSSKPEPAARAAAETTVSSEDSRFQMPYALVLALFALIGLVPVSRRNN